MRFSGDQSNKLMVIRESRSAVRKRYKLKIGAMNCRFFAVTIEVPEQDFRRESFLSAIPIDEAAQIFNQHGQFSSICSRKNKQIDYRVEIHIHKHVNRAKDKVVAIHINLSPTDKTREKGEKPPFADEIFQWVNQFIKDKAAILLLERCEFVFLEREYQSVFSLPLRMSGTLNYTGHPLFESSEMIGLRVLINKNQTGIASVTQEIIKGKGILVTVRRRADTSPAKILSIDTDVSVLYGVAKSTVRAIRRLK